MYSLGLSPALRREYEATLRTSHRIRVTVTVRDRNEDVIATIRPKVLGGSVQVDATAAVTRSLSMELLDPAHKLAFDAPNPSDMALYADNFLEVEYGVYLADSQRWVDVPVFWGTVTGFSRQGPKVTLEAQGKEALALDPHFVVAGYTLRKGMTVKAALQNVMRRVGERRFRLGAVSGKLAKARAVTPGESPWLVCLGGGEDANGNTKPGLMSRARGNVHLYYNGAGFLSAKRRNSNTVWTFTEAQLTSEPGFKYDVLSFRNYAVVTGGVRKGSKLHARGTYALPSAHPLSPARLARNGDRRFMSIFFEADNLKTNAACAAKAKQLVNAASFEGVEASFECLPVPHLEELDVVTLRTSSYSITFPLKQFTIPLTTDSPMTVGASFRARRRRRR